jgi:hypothetical protein
MEFEELSQQEISLAASVWPEWLDDWKGHVRKVL